MAIMRQLAVAVVLGVMCLAAGATPAAAATTAAQLVELMRAGIGDDVLIALIQTDGSTFQLSAQDILSLHQQGVSDVVIRAMLATAKRPTQTASPAPAPAAQTQPAPAASADYGASWSQQASVEMPPAPGAVNVTQTVTQHVDAPAQVQSGYPYMPFYTTFFASPVFVTSPVVVRSVKPVYWGWGGQRRPDSWDDRAVVQPVVRATTPAPQTVAFARKGAR
jgi:hypothetical protein